MKWAYKIEKAYLLKDCKMVPNSDMTPTEVTANPTVDDSTRVMTTLEQLSKELSKDEEEDFDVEIH